MIVQLLTEHHLEFLSLKGGCRGSPESTHVKMPHGWKSQALAQLTFFQVIPSLSTFCIYAAIGVFILYILQATYFVACLTLDQKRL